MQYFFWFSIFMIFYAYFGYPLCLFVISVFKRRSNLNTYEVASEDYKPSVTFIITVFNEESRIREKIEGTLSQDYPKEKLEIIVASDCSTDSTDDIVQSYGKQHVKLVRSPDRKGKENAQKFAVDISTGEIMVFSDVSTTLKSNGVSNIVKNFKDPTIGCVSSEDRFVDEDGKISGEGVYVKYEMILRNIESKVNTLVGLSGSFFAARSEVCEDWAVDLQSDFSTLLNSIKLGLRGISDPNSIGYYKNVTDEKKEFNRKVRTVLRGISVFAKSLSLLNPIKYRLFSWQLFSHKLCRWLVPFFLIIAFASNILIRFSSIYFLIILILQIAFYTLAFFYFHQVTRQLRSSTHKPVNNEPSAFYCQLLKFPYYFVTVNAAILVAWWKYIKGERATFWEPSKR